RFGVARAAVGKTTERFERARALREQIGLELIAVGCGELVVEELEQRIEITPALVETTETREGRLERAHEPARRLVRLACGSAVLIHALFQEPELHVGPRRAHGIAVSQPTGVVLELIGERRGRFLFVRRLDLHGAMLAASGRRRPDDRRPL